MSGDALALPLSRELQHEFQESVLRQERARKLSTMFEKPLSYRYVPAGTDGLGRKVWFCWSCHRNVAGYFLGWREVIGKKGTKRDQWLARKAKRRAQEMANRRAASFQAKQVEVTV